MTRKDYNLIADAIRISEDKKDIIENLCRWLKEDNPAFKENVFRKACTTESL